MDNGDVIEYELDSETWNEVEQKVEVAGVEWLTEKLDNKYEYPNVEYTTPTGEKIVLSGWFGSHKSLQEPFKVNNLDNGHTEMRVGNVKPTEKQMASIVYSYAEGVFLRGDYAVNSGKNEEELKSEFPGIWERTQNGSQEDFYKLVSRLPVDVVIAQ